MTYPGTPDQQQPPIIPPNQPYPAFSPYATPPKKKHTVRNVLLIFVAGLVALCGVGTIVAAANGGAKPSPSPTCDVIGINGCTTKQGNGGGPAIAPTHAAAPAAKVKPDPKGFTIGVKTLKKECFGSAGCNITFRIDPSYNGTAYTDTTTWEVVYQVNGGEDPLTNRFTLHGGQASFDEEEFIQTKSSSAVLSAVVVEINEG